MKLCLCHPELRLACALGQESAEVLSLCNKALCEKKRPKKRYSYWSRRPKTSGPHPARKNVPSHMGWLWNIDTKKTKQGWKPGAIPHNIKNIMTYFLKDFPIDTVPISQFHSQKPRESTNLNICEKQGRTYITCYKSEDPDPEPCMKSNLQIQFNIINKEKDSTCRQPAVRICSLCGLQCSNESPCKSDAEYEVIITAPMCSLASERTKVCQSTQYLESDCKRQTNWQSDASAETTQPPFWKPCIIERGALFTPSALNGSGSNCQIGSKRPTGCPADKNGAGDATIENGSVNKRSCPGTETGRAIDLKEMIKCCRCCKCGKRCKCAKRCKCCKCGKNLDGTVVYSPKKSQKRQTEGLMPPPILSQIDRRGKPTLCCQPCYPKDCC